MIVNTPEDKLSTLEITQSANETDEGKILEVAKKIVEENPKVVADIKSGKQQAMFFLIGQIKKELGSVDISTTKKIIEGLI
jgi:aspartyl-tRNA(Asn)/glutamyl-tRNA(Gln) amidotransferase subunit B